MSIAKTSSSHNHSNHSYLFITYYIVSETFSFNLRAYGELAKIHTEKWDVYNDLNKVTPFFRRVGIIAFLVKLNRVFTARPCFVSRPLVTHRFCVKVWLTAK